MYGYIFLECAILWFYMYQFLECAIRMFLWVIEWAQTRNPVVQPVAASSPRVAQPSEETRGAIRLILGPMFSGKTRELKRRADERRVECRLRKQNERVVVIRFKHDNRYNQFGQGLATHPGVDGRVAVDSDTICAEKLLTVLAEAKTAKFVFIDEGQFYPDLKPFCLECLRAGVKELVISALDADAQQNMWPSVGEVLPWCTFVEKRTAICTSCAQPAILSKRFKTENEEKIDIGASDKYYVSCFACDK